MRLENSNYLQRCLHKIRILQSMKEFSKNLLARYQSVPAYYACMAVRHYPGSKPNMEKTRLATQTRQTVAVPDWMPFLSEDCEHPLPPRLTKSLMGRTIKDGESWGGGLQCTYLSIVITGDSHNTTAVLQGTVQCSAFLDVEKRVRTAW